MIILDYSPYNKIAICEPVVIKTYNWINKQIQEKGLLFLTAEFQWVNVEGMLGI